MSVREDLIQSLRDDMANNPRLVDTIARLCLVIKAEQLQRAEDDIKDLSVSKEREHQRYRTYSDIITLLETLVPEERKEWFNAARKRGTA